MIAHRFPAYSFEVLDDLPFDRVFDLQVAAEWLGEQEAKAQRVHRSPRASRPRRGR